MIRLDIREMEEKLKNHVEEHGDDTIGIYSEHIQLVTWSNNEGVEWVSCIGNSGCTELNDLLTQEKLSLRDISILGTLIEMDLEELYKLFEELHRELQIDEPLVDDCYGCKIYKLWSDATTIYKTFVMFKQAMGTVTCSYCGKVLTENDMILQHEYGNFYCSYKCLCIDGFSGHWHRRSVEDAIQDNTYEMLD